MNPTTALALLYSYATTGEIVRTKIAEDVPEAEIAVWASQMIDGCPDREVVQRFGKLMIELGDDGDVALELAKRMLKQPHATIDDKALRAQMVDSMLELTSAFQKTPCREWLDFQAARSAMLTSCWLPLRKQEEVQKVWADGVWGPVSIIYWLRLLRLESFIVKEGDLPQFESIDNPIGKRHVNCLANELNQHYQKMKEHQGDDGDFAMQIAREVSGLPGEIVRHESPAIAILESISVFTRAVNESYCREWIELQAARTALLTTYYIHPEGEFNQEAWSQGLLGPLVTSYLLSVIRLKSIIAMRDDPPDNVSKDQPSEQLGDGFAKFNFDLPPGSYLFNCGGDVTERNKRTWGFSVVGDDEALTELSAASIGETLSAPFEFTVRRRSMFYVSMDEYPDATDEWFVVLQKPASK